jgi:hypothetical protein
VDRDSAYVIALVQRGVDRRRRLLRRLRLARLGENLIRVPVAHPLPSIEVVWPTAQ